MSRKIFRAVMQMADAPPGMHIAIGATLLADDTDHPKRIVAIDYNDREYRREGGGHEPFPDVYFTNYDTHLEWVPA